MIYLKCKARIQVCVFLYTVLLQKVGNWRCLLAMQLQLFLIYCKERVLCILNDTILQQLVKRHRFFFFIGTFYGAWCSLDFMAVECIKSFTHGF